MIRILAAKTLFDSKANKVLHVWPDKDGLCHVGGEGKPWLRGCGNRF